MCAPVSCRSGKSSPSTGLGVGVGACYKWHVVCASVGGWHMRMWGNGAKLIPPCFQLPWFRKIM